MRRTHTVPLSPTPIDVDNGTARRHSDRLGHPHHPLQPDDRAHAPADPRPSPRGRSRYRQRPHRVCTRAIASTSGTTPASRHARRTSTRPTSASERRQAAATRRSPSRRPEHAEGRGRQAHRHRRTLRWGCADRHDPIMGRLTYNPMPSSSTILLTLGDAMKRSTRRAVAAVVRDAAVQLVNGQTDQRITAHLDQIPGSVGVSYADGADNVHRTITYDASSVLSDLGVTYREPRTASQPPRWSAPPRRKYLATSSSSRRGQSQACSTPTVRSALDPRRRRSRAAPPVGDRSVREVGVDHASLRRRAPPRRQTRPWSTPRA